MADKRTTGKASLSRTRRPGPHEPPAHFGRRALLAVTIVLVSGITAAVHWPVLGTQAIFLDDHQYVLANPLVQQPGWTSAARFLAEVGRPSTVAGYYHPLTMISLMRDWSAGGRADNLRPFHATNLALHVANTALVTLLLYLLFGRILPAAACGLLFGVHPLAVETIAWITERKTLLATFFALAALITYVAWARRPRRVGFPDILLYIATLAAYIFALLAKPTAIPLPLAFLLLDWWPLRRLSPRALIEKIPLFAIAAAGATITVISQRSAAGFASPSGSDPGLIALAIAHNVALYARNLLWPLHLAPYYPYPEPLTIGQPMVLAGLILAVLLALALIALALRTRAPLAGFLLFAVLLLPTLNIIGFTHMIAADKFLYLPAVGLLILLAAGLSELRRRRPAASARTRWILAPLAGAGVLAFLILDVALTRNLLAEWQDTERLHRFALARTPEAYRLRANLGVLLAEWGRPAEAREELDRVLTERPDHWFALTEQAKLLRDQQRLPEALARLEQAVQLNPDHYPARYYLGLTYYDLGRHAEAVAQYEAARALQPNDYRLHTNLGNALSALGRHAEALARYDDALRLAPEPYARGHYNRAMALATLNRHEEALAALRRTLELDPNHAGARRVLAASEAAAATAPAPKP